MTPHDIARATALLDEGRAHLDAGNTAKAEACFKKAASLSDLPAARNNWALCRYVAGAHAEVLQILAPILLDADPAPFARALACRSLAALGETEKANRELKGAIRDLDAGLAQFQRHRLIPEPAWVEYTVPIKQAAGALGHDRMVLDLHGRWPGRDLPGGAFAAGVAAFHLGRYEQAAKYWGRITTHGWAAPMQAYVRTATLLEAGLVPPFRLEHEPPADSLEELQGKESAEELSARGSVRIRMLAYVFEPEAPDKSTAISGLITATGEWGMDLGQRLLDGPTVPIDVKLGAAQALTELGVYAPGEPIPIIHEGKPSSIIVKRVEEDESEEGEQVFQRARALRDAGKPGEAMRLLEDLTLRGIAYPPALMMQANLMRTSGDLDGARRILESLEKLGPDDAGVLFNLASLWIQYGNLERARSYANRIQTTDMPKEFQRLLNELKDYLRRAALFENLPSPTEIANARREEIEERPISLTVTLAGALRQIPVEWLNAAAAVHGLPPAKRRSEREKALAGALKDPGRLRTALAAEGDEVRACLKYLLNAGGWSKLQALTKSFGSQEEDGFFWDEQPPTSTIGRVRLLGLAFVGRAAVGGRRYKVVVIPEDLRALLVAAIQA